jgi:hypothetical protein
MGRAEAHPSEKNRTRVDAAARRPYQEKQKRAEVSLRAFEIFDRRLAYASTGNSTSTGRSFLLSARRSFDNAIFWS